MSLDEVRTQAVFFFDSRLQTCSLGQIVSFNTIFDADVHMRHSLLLTMFAPQRQYRHSSHFRRERQVSAAAARAMQFEHLGNWHWIPLVWY